MCWLHIRYRICLSGYKPFCATVFESLCCLCLLARPWLLSAAQTRDSILPKGPTVDLVTAAIFARSSSSSISSSLNLSHALSTSNIQEEGNSLATHTECTYIYSFFSSASYLLTPFQLKFPLCRELSQIQICFIGTTGKKPVLPWQSTSVTDQYFHISVSQLLHLFISASPSLWLNLNLHFTSRSCIPLCPFSSNCLAVSFPALFFSLSSSVFPSLLSLILFHILGI